MLQGEAPMASRAGTKEICGEAICPICLKRFTDLVILEGCGHQSCKGCLNQYWQESDTESSCPQCRGAVEDRKFRPNSQVANVNVVKLEEEEKAEEEIVCKEEEAPVALGYEESKEQQGHGEFSVDETSQDSKMAESGAAGSSHGRKGRGVSWRHKETLDLLDIWGEQKIQDQLRSSHRNIDFFEYIAQEMSARGHRRTAVECRSKTKVMRLEYKRVIGHNSRLGSSKVTCPFYKQLHRILRGDASVRLKRVSRSLGFKGDSQQEPAPDPPVLEEQFSPGDLNIINIGDYIKEESMDNMGDGTMSANGNEEEMPDVGDVIQTEEEGSNGGRGRDLDSQGPQVSREAQSAPDTVELPAVPSKEVELPATRLSLIRNKKKREGAESMFHLFMEQAREDSQKEQEEMARDRVVLARFLRAFEQDAADSREERRQCLEAMRANCEMLQGIVHGLSKLTDAIAGQQQGSTGNQARPPLHLAMHKENLPLSPAPGARSGSVQEALSSHPPGSASVAPRNSSRKASPVTHPPPRVTCNLG